MKLRKGDSVIVISGKYKGKTGTIKETVPSLNGVIMEGVNTSKKHQKNISKRKPAGVYEITRPIDASNVAIAHPSKKSKPARVGYRLDDKGKKSRIYKQTNKEIK